ncbi:hypothetical protein [Enterococcus sp. DIV0187]|uniref:hypothetical protein n=1 Tax=Enterococcus sp. DIV0187 TaxID=2774644 RepID=UPI003F25DAFD
MTTSQQTSKEALSYARRVLRNYNYNRQSVQYYEEALLHTWTPADLNAWIKGNSHLPSSPTPSQALRLLEPPENLCRLKGHVEIVNFFLNQLDEEY